MRFQADAKKHAADALLRPKKHMGKENELANFFQRQLALMIE